MTILATILSALSLVMGILLLIQVKNPFGWITIFPKMIAAALSPYWAIIGAAGALIGWLYAALWAIPMGIVGAGLMIWYVWRCTRDHKGLEDAFGADWKHQIPHQQAKNMIRRRWSPFLRMNASPEPTWERDVPFWTIPGTDQQLLCDLWRPASDDVSGLALIYLHGSAWTILDKDFLSRPFFRHLVSQGHTVMDVAYRLIPEVDIYGMVGDAKRAVAWMKANAGRYGVDPERIVLGGASAGGHLSLLAGFAPHHPQLTPEDIKDADLSVCGIVSYYGPTDMLVTYQHENQERIFGDMPPVPIGTKLESTNRLRLDPEILGRYAGRMDLLLGGHPKDALATYQLASPGTHVHPGCPPTLLVQGQQDFITPVNATCELYRKLVESGVPAINVVFPWTDHAFDLLLPQTSPPIQSALYDLDRFLALLLVEGS